MDNEPLKKRARIDKSNIEICMFQQRLIDIKAQITPTEQKLCRLKKEKKELKKKIHDIEEINDLLDGNVRFSISKEYLLNNEFVENLSAKKSLKVTAVIVGYTYKSTYYMDMDELIENLKEKEYNFNNMFNSETRKFVRAKNLLENYELPDVNDFDYYLKKTTFKGDKYCSSEIKLAVEFYAHFIPDKLKQEHYKNLEYFFKEEVAITEQKK